MLSAHPPKWLRTPSSTGSSAAKRSPRLRTRAQGSRLRWSIATNTQAQPSSVVWVVVASVPQSVFGAAGMIVPRCAPRVWVQRRRAGASRPAPRMSRSTRLRETRMPCRRRRRWRRRGSRGYARAARRRWSRCADRASRSPAATVVARRTPTSARGRWSGRPGPADAACRNGSRGAPPRRRRKREPPFLEELLEDLHLHRQLTDLGLRRAQAPAIGAAGPGLERVGAGGEELLAPAGDLVRRDLQLAGERVDLLAAHDPDDDLSLASRGEARLRRTIGHPVPPRCSAEGSCTLAVGCPRRSGAAYAWRSRGRAGSTARPV